MGQVIQLEIGIGGTPEKVWDALISGMDVWWRGREGEAMGMVLEPRPGGRLFRDLGDETGHFWGHVQVIKPPRLLEICGPLFFSSPVLSHLSFRLREDGGKTVLTFTHSVNGEVDPEFTKHADGGWRQALEKGLKQYVEQH